VGDGGHELAGENTPTPASSSFENMELFSSASCTKSSISSSARSLSSGEVAALLSSDNTESVTADEDDVSSMRMEGIVSRITTGLSEVDALATSTTPSVRAMRYEEISSMPRIVAGKMNKTANTRIVYAILATHEEES